MATQAEAVDYQKPRRTWRRYRLRLLLIGVICLGVYAGEYYRLRASHSLVRRATFYTDDGRIVHTDTIEMGDLHSWGSPGIKDWLQEVEAALFIPARFLESRIWRWRT